MSASWVKSVLFLVRPHLVKPGEPCSARIETRAPKWKLWVPDTCTHPLTLNRNCLMKYAGQIPQWILYSHYSTKNAIPILTLDMCYLPMKKLSDSNRVSYSLTQFTHYLKVA